MLRQPLFGVNSNYIFIYNFKSWWKLGGVARQSILWEFKVWELEMSHFQAFGHVKFIQWKCIDLKKWTLYDSSPTKSLDTGSLDPQTSQAKQAQTSELPAHSRPSGPEAGGTPGSATGAVSALKARPVERGSAATWALRSFNDLSGSREKKLQLWAVPPYLSIGMW